MREGTPATVGQGGGASAPVPRRCAGCSPGLYRRVNRSTLLERTLLTWFGLFPWECVSCRRKRFFRDQGRKGTAPAS